MKTKSSTTKNLNDDKINNINESIDPKIYNNFFYLMMYLAKKNPIIIVNFILINFRAFISSKIPGTIALLTETVTTNQSWNVIIKSFYWSFFISATLIFLRIFNIWTDNKTSVAIDKNLSSLLYKYLINQNGFYRHKLSSVNFSINGNNLLRLSKAWSKANRLLFMLVELILCLWNLYSNGNVITNGISIGFIITYIIFFIYIIPKNQNVTNKSIHSWNGLCKFINNTFNYLNTIHLFNGNNNHSKMFQNTVNEIANDRNNMLNTKMIILSFVDISFILYQYGILLLIIVAIYKKQLSCGFLTLFSILVYRVYHNLKEILSEYKIIEDFSVFFISMKNLFFNPLITRESYDNRLPPLELKHFNIKIKNLKYKNMADDMEENVILGIKQLEFLETNKYVIVGYSGCGKTTLSNLLVNLYPYEGNITINNKNLQDYNVEDIRKYIHLLSQESSILPITIGENISYSNPQSSWKFIEEAAKKACIHEFIMTLPQQYNTLLDDNITLSVGQKQRILLARIFLSNAPIIILDESTSSLDMKTEAIIYDNIKKHLQNKTVIIIAHRLGVLNYFDNVIFMDKGNVVCQGNHKKLLENLIYKNFVNHFEINE